MNKYMAFLLCNLIVLTDCWAESFLKPTQFPKTINDLSFTQQVQLLKDDYDIYESEYDEDGVCITNCAYAGITIKEEEKRIQQDTEFAWRQLFADEKFPEPYVWTDKDPHITKTVTDNNQGQQNYNNQYVDYWEQHRKYINQQQQQYNQYIQNQQQNNQSIQTPLTAQIKQQCQNNTNMPCGLPLKSKYYISSGFGMRSFGYHKAIDFAVENETPVYSTADGTVTEIIDNNGCGKGVRIYHTSKLYTVYCHLSSQSVVKNQQVKRGELIGLSGNSGNSRGKNGGYHLHYQVELGPGREINPTLFTLY